MTAPTRRAAILMLDEWAGAHASQLHPLDSFMADFSLTDDGKIVLNGFGEDTTDSIWDLCCPELDALRCSGEVTDDAGEIRPEGMERIRAAVEYERKRLLENQPEDESATELGKELASQMGTSAVVADHYVGEITKRILESRTESWPSLVSSLNLISDSLF